MKIDTNMKHFYMQKALENFSTYVIKKAEEEIIVVNPFINRVTISKELGDASSERGVRTIVICRKPSEDDKYDQANFHKELINEGVKVFYHKNVHAKITIIDRSIAIISSMNFIPTSVGGTSWEAGLVTYEIKTVSDTLSSVLKMQKQAEPQD